MYAPPPASEEDTLRVRGWRLYAWGLGSLVLVGVPAVALGLMLLASLHEGGIYSDGTWTEAMHALFLLGLLPGVSVGVIQYLALWDSLTRLKQWLAPSVLSWCLSALLIPLLDVLDIIERLGKDRPGLLLICGYVAYGAAMGWWQGRLLRPHGPFYWRYLVLTALGFFGAIFGGGFLYAIIDRLS